MEGEAMSETNKHAQVGALMAKCGYCEVGTDGKEWHAVVGAFRWAGLTGGSGPTQLAAIKAAVEAAEQGVRE